MSYDDERANKIFTLFCYSVLIALAMGTCFGAIVVLLFIK